jgi:hypothetical protein
MSCGKRPRAGEEFSFCLECLWLEMTVPLPELISAYLDGEVTPEERTLVEQTLVDDPHLRRLFYDLRALRNRLAQLPRYRVKSDLSREIVRRAEIAIQRSRGAVAPDLPRGPETPPDSGSSTDLASATELTRARRAPARRWQVFAWLGAALAAALLLVLIPPGPSDRPEVAQVSEPLVKSLRETESLPKPLPQQMAGRDGVPNSSPQADSIALEARDAKQIAIVSKGAALAPRSGAQTKDVRPGAAPNQPADSLVADPSMQTDAVAKSREHSPLALRGAMVKQQQSPAESAPGLPESAGVRLDALDPGRPTLAANGGAPSDGTVTIRCDVASGKYEQVVQLAFARQHITWVEPSADVTKRRPAEPNSSQHDLRTAFADKASAKDDESVVPVGRGVLPRANAGSATAADLVYVEATPEQIAGVLADFRAQPDLFLATSIHPVPGAPEQTALADLQWNLPAIEPDSPWFRYRADPEMAPAKAGAPQNPAGAETEIQRGLGERSAFERMERAKKAVPAAPAEGAADHESSLPTTNSESHEAVTKPSPDKGVPSSEGELSPAAAAPAAVSDNAIIDNPLAEHAKSNNAPAGRTQKGGTQSGSANAGRAQFAPAAALAGASGGSQAEKNKAIAGANMPDETALGGLGGGGFAANGLDSNRLPEVSQKSEAAVQGLARHLPMAIDPAEQNHDQKFTAPAADAVALEKLPEGRAASESKALGSRAQFNALGHAEADRKEAGQNEIEHAKSQFEDERRSLETPAHSVRVLFVFRRLPNAAVASEPSRPLPTPQSVAPEVPPTASGGNSAEAHK